MSSIHVEDDVEITDQDINDLFVTAVEGGINYWAQVGQIDYNNSVAKIWADNMKYEINHATIMMGLQQYADERLWANFGFAGFIDWFDNSPDANDVDIIIQYGLFGEIVYS